MNNPKLIKALKYSVIVISFVSGYAIHDTVKNTYAFTTNLFAAKPYIQPLSDYDQRTNALHASATFQATCKAGAKSIIALEIAQEKKNEAIKYLGEFDKQSILSQFNQPSSIVVTGKK